MDKIFKFTPSEYAKLRGISTSAVRKRRLNGLEKNNFKIENGKYYYTWGIAVYNVGYGPSR